MFRGKLKTYLQAGQVAPDLFQVWFWERAFGKEDSFPKRRVDETSFSLRVLRRKCWTRRGCRREVTGQRSRGRVNVMGGLRYHDKSRLCFFVDKGNADSFFEQLVKLNEFVKQ